MYHIYTNGYRITTSPISHAEIIASYGSVLQLESVGFILVKV